MATSIPYAAPEVVRGRCENDEEHIDVRAHDVWSLGCILFELLTGTVLFHTGPSVDMFAAVKELQDTWVSTRFTKHMQLLKKFAAAGRWSVASIADRALQA